jgi:tetratricopeptide (TPR) repeat protein
MLVVLLLLAAAGAEPAAPLLPLKDGRVLHGRKVERRAKEAVLGTDFGELRVPASELLGKATAPAPPLPPLRTEKTRWLLIEHDLAEDRARLYADQLDAFFDWMVGIYALDRDRVLRDAPYGVRVFRRREDFKRFQRENAPDIEKKGQAFAEGVAGFYSPRHGRLFLWDAEGSRGGFHLEVAKHETTHLLNDLMARQLALRLPTWFEEGSATYFSMFVAGAGPEPEDHPGAFAQVLGDLDGGKPMASRELRSVPWETFHGREYSWGWAQVRFFRQHGKGGRWGALLDYLKTISGGPVTDSEERRFLEAAGFKSSGDFDKAWHEHLKATRTAERQYVGTSPEVLGKIAAIAKPSPAMARDFARIGVSLARVHEAEPAIVYLRAALRGGIAEAEVPYELARALALSAAAPEDAPWPDEAVGALREAVRLAPLSSAYRLALGRQLLARRETDAAYAELGFSLVLLGSSDDDVAAALGCLRAAARREPGRAVDALAEALAESAPPAAQALRTAAVYHLQDAGEWEKLEELIVRRGAGASAEERAMLAALYGLTDRCEEALPIWRELVATDEGLRYWPDLVDCLLRMDRRADAKAALSEAFAAVEKAPPELRWVRRRLERIRVE